MRDPFHREPKATKGSLGYMTDLVDDTTPQLGGFLDPNGNYIGMAKGGDIASASPLVIDTDGDYFDVTGTTGFAVMTVAANRHFFLQFDGILTMTHHATNLDLPGEANITTAAGDIGEFFSTGANTVQCVNYTRAVFATAFSDIKQAASITATGVSERSTDSEAIIGTDTERHITPANLTARLAALNSSLDVRDFIHDDGSGANNVISTMAFIPRQKSSGWPQAALNDLELPSFWIDVYKASQPDATSLSRGGTAADTPGAVAACSRSGVVLWTDISWQNARIATSNRTINGRSCHLVTPFERFAVLNLIMAAGQWGQQRGNNSNGRDIRDADNWENYGITDPVQAAYRKLTGSGPASWWHNGLPGRGIHNMVANIYEWEDLRLEAGIFQPKAYLAGATTAAGTYIDYDDNANGDGADVCQLTPGVYTITDGTNGNEDVTVEQVIITGRFTGRLLLATGMSTDHIDNALIQLKTAVDLCQDDTGHWKMTGKLLEGATSKYMALPDHADISTHSSIYLDSWYAYDNAISRVLRRCGDWGRGTYARSGLLIGTDSSPTGTSSHFGFRAALSIGNQ